MALQLWREPMGEEKTGSGYGKPLSDWPSRPNIQIYANEQQVTENRNFDWLGPT